MFYGKIDKNRLADFLEDVWEMIASDEWCEAIPLVVGHKPYLPVSFEDAEQHLQTFRGNDQLLAYESAKHTELHHEIISIVKFIIDVNKRHEMWKLHDDEEYPGISFAFALALQDKKQVSLYADFLLSVESRFTILYVGYDIIKLIKKWGWCPDTYYLLFAYWFSNDKKKESVLEYLSRTGFPIDLKEKSPDHEHFIQSLKLILKQPSFSDEELQGKYVDLFNELIDKYITSDNKEMAESLKVRYQEIIENLRNVGQIEKPQKTAKNTNSQRSAVYCEI